MNIEFRSYGIFLLIQSCTFFFKVTESEFLNSKGSLFKTFGAWVEKPSVFWARRFGGLRDRVVFDRVFIFDVPCAVNIVFRDGTVSWWRILLVSEMKLSMINPMGPRLF